MKKRIFLCMMLSAVLLICACGSKHISKNNSGETVVKKDSKAQEGFKLKKCEMINEAGFEKDGMKVNVTGLSYEEQETKINLTVQNDTDAPLVVITANLSINGFMSTESFFSEIPAKSTKEDAAICISNSWLKEMDITQITQAEFIVKVYDHNNNELMKSDVLLVKTDASKSYEQEYDESGFVICEDKGIRLLVRSLQKSTLSNDMEITLYAENDTDSTVSIMARDVTVNGIEIKPQFVMTVGPKKKAVDTMVFFDADLKEHAILNIESVNASFKAYNENLEAVLETEILRIPLSE